MKQHTFHNHLAMIVFLFTNPGSFAVGRQKHER